MEELENAFRFCVDIPVFDDKGYVDFDKDQWNSDGTHHYFDGITMEQEMIPIIIKAYDLETWLTTRIIY